MKTLVTLAIALAVFTMGCLSPAEARTANAIMNGVACGIAAAQETPCTPKEVLEALARDAEAQRAKVEAVAPQASAADAELTQRLLEQLEANTAANAAVAKALVELAARSPASASSEAPSSPSIPTTSLPGTP